MNKIKELTEACAECAGSLSGLILGNPQNIPDRAIQHHALESFGFIIAFLCYSGGISLDEAGSCNACFIGLAFGHNKDHFYKSAKSIDFYLRVFIKYKDSREDFLKRFFDLSGIDPYKTLNAKLVKELFGLATDAA